MPQGVAASSIAAAYARATGRPPARDAERKQFRAYSAWEVLQALAQLSPPLQPLGAAAARPAPAAAPPPPPPALLLVVVVRVPPDWLPMVRSREAQLSAALAAALGRPVWLVLRGVEL